jgi:hypothetical protein
MKLQIRQERLKNLRNIHDFLENVIESIMIFQRSLTRKFPRSRANPPSVERFLARLERCFLVPETVPNITS